MSLDKKPPNPGKPAPHTPPKAGGLHASSLGQFKAQQGAGPGQSRTGLMKNEVEDYKRSHPQPQAKPGETQPSLLKRLAGMFKGRGNAGS